MSCSAVHSKANKFKMMSSHLLSQVVDAWLKVNRCLDLHTLYAYKADEAVARVGAGVPCVCIWDYIEY